MTTLNDTFEWKLALEDEGYESGIGSLNIPTPLCRTPYLYHVSASENVSFNPATPLTHWAYSPQWHSSLSSLHHHLTFSDDENSSTDSSPVHGRAEQSSPAEHQIVHHHIDGSFKDVPSEEEEEDFPTAPLDGDIWLDEPVPDKQTGTYTSMNSQNYMTCALTFAHTAWISYSPLQKMHQHHIMRWWTSVTSSIFQMWWQPPAMKTSLIWMMFLGLEYGQ